MKYSTHNTDQQLLEGCQEGNLLAQRYLYERYGGRMLAIAMRYTSNREEAVEVLNTAFFKIFKSINNYQPIDTLSAWMAKIVFHTSIDHIRQVIKYRNTVFYNEFLPENPTENDALNDLAVEEIYALIQELPPATKAVFSLYVIDGYKHQEIATMLNISEGTSKWHLAEARKVLKQRIEALPKSLTFRP
jgi:RNA polymerase sigma factor (sigma-70 family)